MARTRLSPACLPDVGEETRLPFLWSLSASPNIPIGLRHQVLRLRWLTATASAAGTRRSPFPP